MSNFWVFSKPDLFYSPSPPLLKHEVAAHFSVLVLSQLGFFRPHTDILLVLARGKQPRLINYIHKYLMYFDVLRGFKGKERNPRLVKNKFYPEENEILYFIV